MLGDGSGRRWDLHALACPPRRGDSFSCVSCRRGGGRRVCLCSRTCRCHWTFWVLRSGSWASSRFHPYFRSGGHRCDRRRTSWCWVWGASPIRLQGAGYKGAASVGRHRWGGRRTSVSRRGRGDSRNQCGNLHRRAFRRVSTPRTKTCPPGPQACCWAGPRRDGAYRCLS